jgi:hypothetical protein
MLGSILTGLASVPTADGADVSGGGSSDATPGVVGKFSGAVIAGEGATFGYMADPGGDLAAVNDNPVDPNLYQTGARTISVLRVTAVDGNGFAVPFTVTLYQNGAPTAQSVSVPAGTIAGTKFVDAGHPIAFAAGDTFDVRWDIPGASGDNQRVSAVLEGPNGGTSGAGIAGYSWLATQLGRANALLLSGPPILDSPWYTDLIVNPGNNNIGQNIEWGPSTTGSASVTKSSNYPGGVYLLDTGATASSVALIGTPNSETFILQNPASGPFYIAVRCKIATALAAGSYGLIQCINVGNGEALQLIAQSVGYYLNLVTVAGGSTLLGPFGTPDLNAHDYAIGFDGVTVTAFLDGVPIAGLSTTDLLNLTAATLSISSQVFNLGAASAQLLVDKLCCIQRSIQ